MHDHKLYTVQCFDMLQSVFSLILPCLVQALVKSPTSLWKHSSSLAEAVSWESGDGATGNQGVRSRRSNQPTWNCLRLRCHQSKHLKLWFFVCQLYLASSSHRQPMSFHKFRPLEIGRKRTLKGQEMAYVMPSLGVCRTVNHHHGCPDFLAVLFQDGEMPQIMGHIGRMRMSQDKL